MNSEQGSVNETVNYAQCVPCSGSGGWADLAGRRVEDGSWRGGRAPRYLLVHLEPRWLHRVFLGLYHPDYPLLGTRVVRHSLLGRCVPAEQ